MDTNERQLTKKFKTFHIILLSFLLGSLLILNSNNVNEKKTSEKISKEKDDLFNNLINKRFLEEKEDSEEKSNSEKVCENASTELKSYYKSGDVTKIELKEEEEIECEVCKKDYMEALISLVRKYLDDDKKKSDDISTENSEKEEEEKSDKDYIITYARRILLVVILLIIAIFSIIGWIICGFCACCNCCCCCCCKKERCKVPCFIFTYIFYAVAIIACIYGLTQTNKIFVGLADTECSVLRLLDQIVDGELKMAPPKWIGISQINQLLTDFKDKINKLKNNTINNLNNNASSIDTNGKIFFQEMKKFGDSYYNGGNYLDEFKKTFTNLDEIPNYNNKTYILDIVKQLGHYDDNSENYIPSNSFLSLWNEEYSEVANRADSYIKTTKDNFNLILQNKSEEIMNSLDEAEKTLNELKEPFDDVNKEVGGKISDYSEKIDKYGKRGVKLVFSILMLVNLLLAVLVLFICLCSAKCCAECCCCCRCLFKTLTHILWNFLALMMILAFIIGAILATVGRIGEDAMSLVSYVASVENFESSNPLLLGKLGKAKKYLNVSLHGDGNLENEFNINDSINSINEIDDVLNKIKDVSVDFKKLIDQLPTYNSILQMLTERIELNSSKIALIGENEEYLSDNNIYLFKLLENFNSKIADTKESWSVDGDKDLECDADNSGEQTKKFNLLNCNPIERQWIKDSTNKEIKDYATLISEIYEETRNLKEGDNSFKPNLERVNNKYQNYLNSYLGVVEYLNITIYDLIGELKSQVGDGGIFSFLNGHFISVNLKIILKYLKHSLGEDFYKVGLCLVIVGFSLVLSISSTILLIVIINLGLKKGPDPRIETSAGDSGYGLKKPKIISKY